MAERANRVYMRKRIKDPDNEDNYFDVPVIYEMKFNTMQEQAQERWLYLNNSSTSSRKAHVQLISNIEVERVDEVTMRDMASQAQESRLILINHDPPPMQPDGTNSPAHEKTHIVRFFRENDDTSDCYGDMELIDELIIRDGSSGQEWHYYLRWPELGDPVYDESVPYEVTKGFCDPDLPMAPTEEQG